MSFFVSGAFVISLPGQLHKSCQVSKWEWSLQAEKAG